MRCSFSAIGGGRKFIAEFMRYLLRHEFAQELTNPDHGMLKFQGAVVVSTVW